MDNLVWKTRALLRPPPSLPLGEWIESNVHLPAASSALPGRMRLWPYQRGWADAFDDPAIERVTILKGARVGYTQFLSGLIAHLVAVKPAPIIFLQPTADDARDSSVELEAMFEESPALRGLLSDDQDESGRSTLMSRRFPGGSLKFLAARSPRNLRRHTARFLLMDEIDGYEITQEGDPLTLAERRTLTFANRKILAGSTPVFDYGPVSRLYAESDMRVFEVPCPHCAEFNEILWAQIQWPEDEPERAAWNCPACGARVEERYKNQMVTLGRWRATNPEAHGHAGFRINCLVSLHANASWGKLAREFLTARRSPETLRPFINTILGQAWRTEEDEVDESSLQVGLSAPIGLEALPEDCLWITCGVDCQDDRLEATLLGHGENDLYVLDHRVFWGAIDSNEVWAELDSLIAQTWPHPLGGSVGIGATAIDSGDGGHTDIVTRYARARLARRVVPTKGVAGFSRPFLQKTAGRSHLWLVGVDSLKTHLFARIARKQGLSFAEHLEAHYFEQVASERRVVRYVRGRPEARFERIPGRRAEALDALVYAWAARSLIAQTATERRNQLSGMGHPAATKSKSKFLAR